MLGGRALDVGWWPRGRGRRALKHARLFTLGGSVRICPSLVPRRPGQVPALLAAPEGGQQSGSARPVEGEPLVVNQADGGAQLGWRAWLQGGRPGLAPESGDEQRRHAQVMVEILTRCEDLHRVWLIQLDEQHRTERLANAAAVYHWYLSGLRDRLTTMQAPPSLRAWHDMLVRTVDAAHRATKLISQGYRFHNVRRICDGGVLLEEAQAHAEAIREAIGPIAVEPPQQGVA